jgi:PKD repeat protein
MTRALRNYVLTGVAIAALVASACTMKEQEAPPLTGPSEFGTSITVEITPDSITQDGASQSLITVTARDANGQPLRNVTVRLDTFVNDTLVDFGSLSARTIVTGGDGKATATYTAPPATPNGTEQTVTIRVTPLGSDAATSTPRTASLRLMPQGTVFPPSTVNAAFTVSPTAPVEDTAVLFDASTSEGEITAYEWNFGNGQTGSGVTATTSYREPGTYIVTLTVRDQFGRGDTAATSLTVSGGTAPSPAFTFSPTGPVDDQVVFFNASTSTVPAGRRIVSYRWDFGDGTRVTTSSATTSHVFRNPGTYRVTLTVRDDTGREASTTVDVPVSDGSSGGK